jgi:hypothetical protein
MCTSPGIDIGLGACLNLFLIFFMLFASSSRRPAFCKAPGSPSTPDTTRTTDSRKKIIIYFEIWIPTECRKSECESVLLGQKCAQMISLKDTLAPYHCQLSSAPDG